jgi:hypothetical protein
MAIRGSPFIKQFDFTDGDASLVVKIYESISEAKSGYGCSTWISAPVLAHYIWRHRAEVKGRRVLEVGTGPALPGIVAGRCGAAALTLADSRVLYPRWISGSGGCVQIYTYSPKTLLNLANDYLNSKSTGFILLSVATRRLQRTIVLPASCDLCL